MKTPLILLLALLLAGCDSLDGVSRFAAVHQIPNPVLLQKDIESYPEIKKVWYSEEKRQDAWWNGSSSFSGYHLFYEGDNIRGTIEFGGNGKNQFGYWQYLLYLNHVPSPELVQGTLPFMKKIEHDLETKFGLPEIESNLKVTFLGMNNPEQETPPASNSQAN